MLLTLFLLNMSKPKHKVRTLLQPLCAGSCITSLYCSKGDSTKYDNNKKNTEINSTKLADY